MSIVLCQGATLADITHGIQTVSYTWLILRKILDCTGRDIYGERERRAYNEGLGHSPQRGLGAEPLVRGSEADSILAFAR